jgi:hypothetical protein
MGKDTGEQAGPRSSRAVYGSDSSGGEAGYMNQRWRVGWRERHACGVREGNRSVVVYR